jgi:cytochrome c5
MTIKSKLALVATLATLIAAPAFAADQQASEAALDRAPAQVTIQSDAYASAEKAPRGHHIVRPAASQTETQDFQAVGSH